MRAIAHWRKSRPGLYVSVVNPFTLITAVERFKIPFALRDLSKPALSEVVGGERDFESHPMGDRGTAAHASTVPGTNASTVLSTSGCSAFQRPFLGSRVLALML